MASEFSEYLDHVATARSEYGRYINAFAVRGWVEQLPDRRRLFLRRRTVTVPGILEAA